MTERVRSVTRGDASAIHAIYTPIVAATAISFETVPPTVDEIAERIEHTTATHPWLVLERDERITGYGYAAPFHPREAYRWTAEVSVYVAEAARGAGAGRTLLRAVLAELTEGGFRNAMARIALPNDASVKLFESEGFAAIGIARAVGFKLDRWHDVGEWQKVLGPALTTGPL